MKIGMVAWLGGLAACCVLPQALAQTACPHGVAAGSYGCGPDPSSGVQEVRVYYDAYGAVGFSWQRFKVYPVTQHGGNYDGVKERALRKCAEDGAPDDCQVVQWWRNGCTSLYTGDIDGRMTMFWGFDANYRSRMSKRQARDGCAASGAENCSEYKLGRHTHAICLKAGYRSQ